MTPHLLTLALWDAQAVGELFLALAILKCGSCNRWPFLLALMLFDLAHTSLLLLFFSNYVAYFYTYWIGQGIRSLLSIGLLWDVLRSLPAVKFLPKRIGLFLSCFAVTITMGAVFLTTLHHPHTYPLTAMVLMIQQCATVAWMSLAVCILCAASFLGMGWTLEGVNITAGFVVSGMAAMLAAFLISSCPSHGRVIDLFHTCIDLFVLYFWFTRLRCPASEHSSDSINTLTRFYAERSPV